jgi:hypothetical protein
MPTTPKWYLPVTIAALIWNLVGCVAYLADVTVTPEAISRMSAVQQAMYEARTWWAVSATAVAVWGGAVGSLGLILRKRWAMVLLVASLVGVVVQDVALLFVSGLGSRVGLRVIVLQGMVLVVAVSLVSFAHGARKVGWIA